MKPFKFVDPNSKPEDIEVPVGVSAQFQDEELRNQIKEALNQPVAPAKEAPVNVDATLEAIAGTSGAYAKISRSQLAPTPEEWNQFTPISMDKKVLMAESIHHNGLLQPIVVRAISEANDKFQILAGNTRNELYGLLYDITGDSKYLSIESKVYWYGELTDDQAREIVTDTNYAQRANLTAKDRIFCIHNKIEMLKKRGESHIIDKVAEQMDIKRASVFFWKKLSELIPEFLDMFQNNELSLLAAGRLASFPQDIQRELYEMKDLLTNDIIMKVPSKTIHSQIVSEFRKLIEDATTPKPSYSIDSSWTEEDGRFAIRSKTAPPEGSKPFLVFLPENKIKVFMKSYEDFVVKEE